MTTGELCRLLAEIPPETMAFISLDCHLTVSDRCNDRISGDFAGCFEVDGVRLQPIFVLGQGWQTAAHLQATQEI